MSTIAGTTNNIDFMLAQAANEGLMRRFFISNVAATTTANTTSGYITAQRYPHLITIPSLGSGITGVYFPVIRVCHSTIRTVLVCAIEYLLGSTTFANNTGTFSSGVSMPNKTIRGTSVTTATILPMLAVSTVLAGATTPTITITYTNQDGTTGRTAVLTLPSNPSVNTAFMIGPHLNSGDTGIRSVQNIVAGASITSGVLGVYGLLILAAANQEGATAMPGMGPMILPHVPYIAVAGDTIGFYRFGTAVAMNLHAMLVGVADN